MNLKDFITKHMKQRKGETRKLSNKLPTGVFPDGRRQGSSFGVFVLLRKAYVRFSKRSSMLQSNNASISKKGESE
jgi:hypothetical protein